MAVLLGRLDSCQGGYPTKGHCLKSGLYLSSSKLASTWLDPGEDRTEKGLALRRSLHADGQSLQNSWSSSSTRARTLPPQNSLASSASHLRLRLAVDGVRPGGKCRSASAPTLGRSRYISRTSCSHAEESMLEEDVLAAVMAGERTIGPPLLEKTLTFRPGKLGWSRQEDGLITKVEVIGQAFLNGVQQGWKILCVDGQPFGRDVLKEKISGDSEYHMSFSINGGETCGESGAGHMLHCQDVGKDKGQSQQAHYTHRLEEKTSMFTPPQGSHHAQLTHASRTRASSSSSVSDACDDGNDVAAALLLSFPWPDLTKRRQRGWRTASEWRKIKSSQDAEVLQRTVAEWREAQSSQNAEVLQKRRERGWMTCAARRAERQAEKIPEVPGIHLAKRQKRGWRTRCEWERAQQSGYAHEEAVDDNTSLTRAPLCLVSADPNTQDQNGISPLMRAAAAGRVGLVRTLLAARAQVNAEDSGEATALLHCFADHWVSIAEVLADGRRHNARRTSRGDRTRIARALLQARSYLEHQDCNGLTALMLCAATGRSRASRLLLEYRADPTVRDLGGWTALAWAAHEGWSDLVQLLLHAASGTLPGVLPDPTGSSSSAACVEARPPRELEISKRTWKGLVGLWPERAYY